MIKTSSGLLFEGQLGLILLALARGLLNFIWAIPQLNDIIAAIGATPEKMDDTTHHVFGDLVARLLNPALSSFNSGVRGYIARLPPLPGRSVRSVSWRQRPGPCRC